MTEDQIEQIEEEVKQSCHVKTTNGKRILTMSGAVALVALSLALAWVIIMKPEDFEKVDVISGMVVMAIKDLFHFYFSSPDQV